MLLEDGVVTPISVINACYLGARVDEGSALYSMTSTSPSFLGPTKGGGFTPSIVSFFGCRGPCCSPMVSPATMGFRHLKSEVSEACSPLQDSLAEVAEPMLS